MNSERNVTDTKYVPEIIERVSCARHDANNGKPCFVIVPGASRNLGFLSAICNARARKAGYVGKISTTSVRKKT